MRSMDDILRIACGYLNEHSTEYVIVGGMTVIAYGAPRTTMDADFIIQMEIEDMKNFAVFLGENGFFSEPEDIEIAMKEKSHFSAIDKETPLRLDIKGVYNEMDRRTLKNRRAMTFQGTKIFLASPEDVILGKLLYGSEQDIEDAEGIYVRQLPVLDIQYLEGVCVAEGLSERLDEMRGNVERHLPE